MSDLAAILDMLIAADPVYTGVEFQTRDGIKSIHPGNNLGLTAQQVTDANTLIAAWTDLDDTLRIAWASYKTTLPQKVNYALTVRTEIAKLLLLAADCDRLGKTSYRDQLNTQAAALQAALDARITALP